VRYGAQEIDMVIDRGAFLSGDWRRVYEEIVAVKEVCGPAHLKVILETGELHTLDNVAAASRLAIAAGADFIKTSTGKVQPAATMEVTLVMFEAIREHFLETGRMVGMKPAGGIRTSKLALHYLVLLAETLGADWMSPDWFRFGASALVNDLLRQMTRRDDGYYQSPRRFSVD
jgi:deoxyribose-phosphate aldolase